MFKLKKIHPPFGSADNPVIEASYSEGEIPVIDGLCKVRLPETRDRLLKIGYEQIQPVGGSAKTAAAQKSRKRKW